MSLVPGTAVAQQDSTPPSIVSVSGGPSSDGNTYVLVISFTEPLSTNFADLRLSVTFGDTVQTGTFTFGSVDARRVTIQVTGRVPAAGQTVIVSYSQTAQSNQGSLKDAAGNLVESFRWNVSTNMQIPTVAEVYAALKAYFSGTATLSEVEGVLRSGDNKTYHEKLSEEAAAGRLHERLPANERTKWGTEGSLGWHQVGTPSSPPGPDQTCGGETVPELTGDDRGKFFWACSQDNRWVPVKLAQPDVDYSEDEDLVHPPVVPGTNPAYNEKCRYEDEDGNPTPVFKADFDENGRVVREPAQSWNRRYPDLPVDHRLNLVVQGTTIHGGNWDPIAEKCTTRGGPGP